MRKATVLILVLSLIAISPAAAQACAVFTPPGKRIEARTADGTIVAAAIMHVTEARYLDRPVAYLRPWRARAALAKVLRGDQLPTTVEFERGWGSAACEWNNPRLPRRGDQWVIYFWRDRATGLKPWLAMPLAEARILDARLFKRNR
jgi:hypothetical protein